MTKKFQKFVRGCVIDPELERKAHSLAENAGRTVKEANKTFKKAQKVMENVGDTNQLLMLAGIGLLVFGFVAGSSSENSESSRNSSAKSA